MLFSSNVAKILANCKNEEKAFSKEKDTPFFHNVTNKHSSANQSFLIKPEIIFQSKTPSADYSTIISEAMNNVILHNSLENYNKAFQCIQKLSRNRNQSNDVVNFAKSFITEDLEIILSQFSSLDSMEKINLKLIELKKAIEYITSLLYSPIRSYSFSREPNQIITDVLIDFVKYNPDIIKTNMEFALNYAVQSILNTPENIDDLTLDFIKNLSDIFTQSQFITEFSSFLSKGDYDYMIYDQEIDQVLYHLYNTRAQIKKLSSKLGETLVASIIDAVTTSLFKNRFENENVEIIQQIFTSDNRELINILLEISDARNDTTLSDLLSSGYQSYTKSVLKKYLSYGDLGGIDQILLFFQSLLDLNLPQIHPVMKAFQQGLNESPSLISFEFARFCNTMILFHQEDFKKNIDLIIHFFGELYSIDNFLTYYMQFLTLRLLEYKEFIPDAEKIMLKHINDACGYNTNASKLEIMIKDAENNSQQANSNSIATFYLIKEDAWPYFSEVEIETPDMINNAFEEFKNQYIEKNPKHQIKWLKILDKVHFTCNSIEIECSAFHYSILLQITQQKEIELKTERDKSAIEDLIKANLIVKHENTYLFTPPTKPVKVSNLPELIPVAEKESEANQINQIRQTALEAGIIKIAKKHQIIKVDDLFNETSSYVKFPLTREDFDIRLGKILKMELLSTTKDGRIQFTP
ncbi:hypothetical protein TVAG_360410 [Trichomonas vaginalis G3]|uniref:Cullin family profile domain-containing protein n=1 Tax=Trichomonas vaginalis (strain ATCC PRA-98 / G3) TaxID=412133 RepID=A2FX81_TRIV3|nr:ubiquitin protein ligase binding [Trichomonas vaginalis G3]EAX90494.1 hypothetical protein TVAG_360410 [Trichomonas vaginalis G3]KAI5538664.1 ubiquitin protein ligase binding [Trichomonas vaginalis G3]|eukprot:XP_001303424.1 hypothetical protein [Trichomonas vaginalis G3]